MSSWKPYISWLKCFPPWRHLKWIFASHQISTNKHRCGLPSSCMLLATWGFSQSGGGEAIRGHHRHVLCLPLHSTFKYPDVLVLSPPSISNHMTARVCPVTLHVSSCRPISDKRAKVHRYSLSSCKQNPFALVPMWSYHISTWGDLRWEIGGGRSGDQRREGASCCVLCNTRHCTRTSLVPSFHRLYSLSFALY